MTNIEFPAPLPEIPSVSGVELDRKGVTGPVTIKFLDVDRATVRVDAYTTGPARPASYKDKEYLGGIVAKRVDGEWVSTDDPFSVYFRTSPGKVPPTYRAAIEAAMVAAVAATWTAELGMRAAYVAALRAVAAIDKDRQMHRESIRAAYEELERLDDLRTAAIEKSNLNAPKSALLLNPYETLPVVRVWKHPDRENDTVRIVYGADEDSIYELGDGDTELREVGDVPNDWIGLVPVKD